MKVFHDNLVWCGACRSFQAASGRDNPAVCRECEDMDPGDHRDLGRERFYVAEKRARHG